MPNNPDGMSLANGDNYIRRLRKDVAKRRMERAYARGGKPTTEDTKRQDKPSPAKRAS